MNNVTAAEIFIGIALLALYFFPTILATVKHKRMRRLIGVLNLFFGWTVIGWLMLWAWGSAPDREA